MSVQDNQLKTTDGFFARVSPRLDAVEEISVSLGAHGSEATGTGAVQIRFVTRSGTNNLQGAAIYNLRHYKFNANTWFNNPLPRSRPKAQGENITHQPGTRVGGPISFRVSSTAATGRSSSSTSKSSAPPARSSRERTILHPSAQAGTSATTSAVSYARSTCWRWRLPTGTSRRSIPRFARAGEDPRRPREPRAQSPIRPIRWSSATTTRVTTSGLTRYPTGRVDVNLTDKHRLYARATTPT